MPALKYLLLTFGICFSSGIAVANAKHPLTDSLQLLLAETSDSERCVELLIDLKDLNEETELNLAYSIQLIRVGAKSENTYALEVSAPVITSRYAAYPEKEDSLEVYVQFVRRLTPGTRQEGLDAYAEMNIAYNRMKTGYDSERRHALATEILAGDSASSDSTENIYRQAKRLMLRGYANSVLLYYDEGNKYSYIPQTQTWEKAFELIRQMPNPGVRKLFANVGYFMLSGAYNQNEQYWKLRTLTDSYIALLDDYYANSANLERRPYLYKDNSYVVPYQQLIRGALNIHRSDYAEQHFREFRKRMTNASGKTLKRNRSYLYELGYLWAANVRKFDQSIAYCDSLISLIAQGEGYFREKPEKINRAYTDRAIVLTNARRYDEAFDSFARAFKVQDSLLRIERNARIETVELRRNMNREQLEQARAEIRNHTITLILFVVFILLSTGTGVIFIVIWRRNRRLQQDILRHSRKAQESEHMKSYFVNSICSTTRAPFNANDSSVQDLMLAEDSNAVCRQVERIHQNTTRLLSAVDSMLEAANLESLSETPDMKPVDIDAICRIELQPASFSNSRIEYLITSAETPCLVRTHAKYFAFALRILLEKASKSISRGRLELGYAVVNGQLTVAVTVTGDAAEETANGDMQSQSEKTEEDACDLSLCRMIIKHMNGTIRTEGLSSHSHRTTFTIPTRP